MTKILIEAESLGPTVIEISKTMKALADKHDAQVKVVQNSKMKRSDIEWCDIVIAVRSLTALDVGIAKIAKNAGRFHILLLDDDFLGLPEDYPIMPQRENALRAMLQYTDVILTTNQLLGEKYFEISKEKRYVLTNTVVSEESIVNPDKKTGTTQKFKILYYVNDASTVMFDKFILPIMPKLAAEFGEKLSLTFLAVKPRVAVYEDDIEIQYIEHMNFHEFRSFLRENHFDIGIAPLEDSGFSRYKYINKFIEYSIAGIPGLYSNCALYSLVIKDKVNGFLCENTESAWVEALRMLIHNPMARERCIKNAQQQLRDDFTADGIVQKLVNDIPELISHRASSDKSVKGLFILKMQYYCFLLNEFWFFANLHLKQDGIIALLKRIVRFLKQQARGYKN